MGVLTEFCRFAAASGQKYKITTIEPGTMSDVGINGPSEFNGSTGLSDYVRSFKVPDTLDNLA
jgi:hypothetical protein